jgi:4-hydroxybutyryl-CoA dehydratase/vinylacetyl-CoA-Delta-isomerase
MGMSSGEFRESLRRLSPRVFVDGRQINSIADDPVLAPGVNGIGFTYDYTLKPENRPLAMANQHTSGKDVSRLLHINQTTDDLMAKLELVRVLCQETGCAMRYLTHDGFNALYQATRRVDDDCGTDYHDRFVDYMHEVQDGDLTVGIGMTDAKGDRSKRPHQQENPDTHVHIVERRKDGIVISGTKAIVTGAPYVHQLLVVPGRAMTEEDADFAVACAVPLDADGLTIVARPAGRPGEDAAKFSGRYGQSTGV